MGACRCSHQHVFGLQICTGDQRVLVVLSFFHDTSRDRALANQTKKQKGTACLAEPAREQELQLLHLIKQ